MKLNRLFSYLLFLVLLMSPVLEAAPSYAQDGGSHEAILAQIPTLLNFAEQAPNTFVGEVDGSYAYIAFVVQENLVVIYLCDSVGVSEWMRAEIVEATINATTESGVVIQATVAEDGLISGTVVLTIDDDGTPATAHNFATAPAVLGETGLARAVDEVTVSGWIVTENGIRGFRAARRDSVAAEVCRILTNEYVHHYEMFQNLPNNSPEQGMLVPKLIDLAVAISANDCGTVPIIS